MGTVALEGGTSHTSSTTAEPVASFPECDEVLPSKPKGLNSAMRVPLDVLDLPSGDNLDQLKLWFQLLPTEASRLHAAIYQQIMKLRKCAQQAVRAAAAVGALQALKVMEEFGISPQVGGGWAVRAAAKGGYTDVLVWFMDNGLHPTEGLRWAARIAAEQGHLETLQWLWANGLSDQFRAGGGLVRGAAQGGQLQVLQWVEDNGLLVVEGGAWSIRLAAQSGDVRVVQWLFEHGMTMQEHGVSALRGAAAGGHLELLRWIAEQEACPVLHECGRALIWAACEGGHLEVLEWLNAQGVTASQGEGAAVWAAARGGHLDVLRWLDEHGVPPSLGGTAVVRAAVKGGYLGVLAWLVMHGLDVRDGGSFCGPQTAAEKGHLQVLKWLVEQGMELAEVASSLTIGAAKGGQLEVLQWLHDHQVAICQYAKGAVQEASAGGHKEVLQWLSLNRISLNEGGWEAVQAASIGGHLDLLVYLSDNGLPIREFGGAAVTGSAKGGHVEILRWLWTQGVEVWRYNREAVQEASAFGHLQVLEWLHQQGFDPTEGGGNALCRAAEGGHLDTLRWLVDHGIDLHDHWRAAVWAASEAVQPDVHHWLLEKEAEHKMERKKHFRRKDRHMTPRNLELPRANTSLSGSASTRMPSFHGHKPGRLASMKSHSSLGTASITSNEATESSSTGLKWMLQYQLDQAEDIYDKLTRMASGGHMEVLEWISTITEPRWTVKLAIQGGHLGALMWIVQSGLDLKRLEEHAVRWAAEAGHVDMLKWFVGRGLRLTGGVIEAAASRGKAVVLDVLRCFPLPLSQHPALAEETVPFLSKVTPTLLANYILVPCLAAESALEAILVQASVRDHKGRPIVRACMASSMTAASFAVEPDSEELRRTLAPLPGNFLTRSAEDVPVKIFKLTCPGAASTIVLRALSVTPRLNVYNTLAAQGIVLSAWQKVRVFYMVDVLLELLQLCAIVHVTTELKPAADARGEYDKDVDIFAAGSLPVTMFGLLVVWVKVVLADVQRIRVYSQSGWGRDLFVLSEAWEWFCLLIMGIFLVAMFVGTNLSTVSPLLSLVGFTRWWKVLYSLRGFDYFGQRILPILGAFREILPFMLVMVFYGGALMHAFYALSYNPVWDVLVAFYRLGVTGELELSDTMWGITESQAPMWWQTLQQVWFIAGSFLFTVALMNIFIAIMSSAFDRKEEQADAEFLRTRSRICLGYALRFEGFTGMCWRMCRFFRKPSSPPPTFVAEDEVVWLCHQSVPRGNLDKARSLRQMVSFASDLLLSETDERLQAQEQLLRSEIAEQLRQQRLYLTSELLPAMFDGYPLECQDSPSMQVPIPSTPTSQRKHSKASTVVSFDGPPKKLSRQMTVMGRVRNQL